MDLRENGLASMFEIEKLINFFNDVNEDEPLNYSITSKMIDFISEYYYNKVKADMSALIYLISLYESSHIHIREKVTKSLMKLMNKNYKNIRKALIISYKEEKPEFFKKEIDKMLELVFSGIYFNYSEIVEAKEELKKLMSENNQEN